MCVLKLWKHEGISSLGIIIILFVKAFGLVLEIIFLARFYLKFFFFQTLHRLRDYEYKCTEFTLIMQMLNHSIIQLLFFYVEVLSRFLDKKRK